jgi:hypothetical protein
MTHEKGKGKEKTSFAMDLKKRGVEHFLWQIEIFFPLFKCGFSRIV